MNQLHKCEALDRNNLIHWSSTGRPYMKKYQHLMPGVVASDLILETPPVKGRERTGYPTQKPLKLLERIIKASSNEGDVVFDPFCGCATTCVASEKLGRKWIGIDLSDQALIQVRKRLVQEFGELLFDIVHRTDIPQRTDQGKIPHYRTQKHTLYGKQEGVCEGCKTHFEFRHLEVDHKTPKKKGGSDHIKNLQLLCGHCNRIKGTGTHEELVAKLIQMDIRKP